MTCREELSMGAYALGTLEPDDRARIAAHLEHCAECRSAAEDFALLPVLLDRIDPKKVEPAVAPSESAFQRLSAAAGQKRRQRRRTLLKVAAVVLALLSGLVVTGIVNRQGGDGGAVTVASSGGVRATVTVDSMPTGSRLTLRLSGVAPEERCRLVAMSKDGRREVAATWQATYEGTATIRGTTGIPASSVQFLLVETLDGRPLVRLTPRS